MKKYKRILSTLLIAVLIASSGLMAFSDTTLQASAVTIESFDISLDDLIWTNFC